MNAKQMPPRMGGSPASPAREVLSHPALEKAALEELQLVLTEAYVVSLMVTDEVTARSVHEFLSNLIRVDRHYRLFTGNVEATMFWEKHLYDNTASNNDAKLDFFFRFTARVFANWSGTDGGYASLVQRLAKALSSEATQANKGALPNTMLPEAYLEALADEVTVYAVLDQNRLLVTIASYVLLADHVSINASMQTALYPPVPKPKPERPVVKPS